MKKKHILTLDDLARMMQNQFLEIDSKMATKEDIKVLESRFDERFNGVDKRLDTVDQRLNIIESLLASNRIERLEDSVRQIKTLLKIK